MAKAPITETPSLTDLRREIDRIDEAMHALLIERGEIIGRLIQVKSTSETGSAFRPAREAALLRRLVARHPRIPPLDPLASCTRVVILTFTYVQAPSPCMPICPAGEPAMRDSARFPWLHGAVRRSHGCAGVVAADRGFQGRPRPRAGGCSLGLRRL